MLCRVDNDKTILNDDYQKLFTFEEHLIDKIKKVYRQKRSELCSLCIDNDMDCIKLEIKRIINNAYTELDFNILQFDEDNTDTYDKEYEDNQSYDKINIVLKDLAEYVDMFKNISNI